jgi:hypothetical protein
MQSTESGGDFRLNMAVLPLGQQRGRQFELARYPYGLCVAPSREKFVHGILVACKRQPSLCDGDREITISWSASFPCQDALCRVHAVALRIVHGNSPLPRAPSLPRTFLPLTTRSLSKIEHGSVFMMRSCRALSLAPKNIGTGKFRSWGCSERPALALRGSLVIFQRLGGSSLGYLALEYKRPAGERKSTSSGPAR